MLNAVILCTKEIQRSKHKEQLTELETVDAVAFADFLKFQNKNRLLKPTSRMSCSCTYINLANEKHQ